MRLTLSILFLMMLTIHAYGEYICGTDRFHDEAVMLAKEWGVGRQAWQAAGIYTPRRGYEVGDTRTLYASIGSRYLPSTVRVKGEHCYIWVHDAIWGGSVTAGQVERIRQVFDDSTAADETRGSYEIDVEAFGPPPDIDNDDRIHILMYNIGEGGVGGYFWPGNEYPSGVQPNSNELDMFYMDDGLDPAQSDFGASVMAHEFQHMINWFHDANEALWLNEGLSGLAEYLSGYLNAGGWAATWAQFTDGNLTEWEPNEGDYFRTAIFCIYMFEQFGGVEFTRALEDEPTDGRYGIDNVLQQLNYDIDFRQLFKNWNVANLLDLPMESFHGGAYGYETINLPVGPGMAQVHSSYPVEPVTEAVDAWGVDYIRLTDGGLLQWGVDAPSSDFRRTEILDVRYPFSGDLPEVQDDGVVENTKVVDLNGFGALWESVIFVVCNTSNNIPCNYQEYTVDHPLTPPVLQGWPVTDLGYLYSSPVISGQYTAVADRNGAVYVLNPDGSVLSGWPVTFDTQVWGSPSFGDVDNDGSSEIIVGTRNGDVHMYEMDGSPVQGWPVSMGSSQYGIASPTTAYDMDGDGLSEIFAASFTGELGCWHADGSPVNGWPVDLGAPLFPGVAVGDVNDDGIPEVAIGSTDNMITVLSAGGSILDGWPQSISGRPWGPPLMVRLRADGPAAIIIMDEIGSVYAFSADGSLIDGWPASFEGERIQAPGALGDMNGDGLLEIVVGTMDGFIHLLDATGQEPSGWPVYMEDDIWGSPLVTDIDADGVQEVVAASKQGKLTALDINGNTLPNWPLVTGSDTQAGPAIADMDGDGTVEIVLPSSDGTVRVWNLSTPFNTDFVHWPQVGRGPFHDSSLLGLQPQDVNGFSVLPDRLQLRFGPVPALDRITLYIPGGGEGLGVTVYDISGRVRIRGTVPSMTEEVTMNISTLPAGSYFLNLVGMDGDILRKSVFVVR